jgi:hypothetical protein
MSFLSVKDSNNGCLPVRFAGKEIRPQQAVSSTKNVVAQNNESTMALKLSTMSAKETRILGSRYLDEFRMSNCIHNLRSKLVFDPGLGLQSSTCLEAPQGKIVGKAEAKYYGRFCLLRILFPVKMLIALSVFQSEICCRAMSSEG